MDCDFGCGVKVGWVALGLQLYLERKGMFAGGLAFGGFQSLGYHFGGPYNKDYSILGSILGSPYFGKLPLSTHPEP